MDAVKCRINRLTARNLRREPIYQMAIIDLANAGAIDKGIAENLLGYKIPDYIGLPPHFKAKEESAADKLKGLFNHGND